MSDDMAQGKVIASDALEGILNVLGSSRGENIAKGRVEADFLRWVVSMRCAYAENPLLTRAARST
jgi:hypothetical protein